MLYHFKADWLKALVFLFGVMKLYKSREETEFFFLKNTIPHYMVSSDNDNHLN